LRARGLATVRTLTARGLLTWEEGAVLFREIPPDLAESWKYDQNTIQAVLGRGALLIRQLLIPSTDPFVRLRDPKWTAEGCPSCGAPIGEHDLRCELCALAATLALEEQP
jgi:hypothetical protein